MDLYKKMILYSTTFMVIFHNKYELVEKIGIGGTGVVYKVINIHNKRKYAMKQLDVTKGMSSSSLVELSILQNTVHKNIIKCYDIFFSNIGGDDINGDDINGDVDDVIDNLINNMFDNKNDCHYLCIILEISNDTLHNHCKNNSFEEIECARLFKQILMGSVYMHSNNISHNDLSPTNIVFDGLNIKIIDMGNCVRMHRMPISIPSILAIPPNYMTKLKNNSLITKNIDSWGLGMIYYLLKNNKYLVDYANLEKNVCTKNKIMKSIELIENKMIREMLEYKSERQSVMSIGKKFGITKETNNLNNKPKSNISLNYIKDSIDIFMLTKVIEFTILNNINFELIVSVMENYYRVTDILNKDDYQEFGKMLLVLLLLSYKILNSDIDIDSCVKYGNNIGIRTNCSELLTMERMVTKYLNWDVDPMTFYWNNGENNKNKIFMDKKNVLYLIYMFVNKEIIVVEDVSNSINNLLECIDGNQIKASDDVINNIKIMFKNKDVKNVVKLYCDKMNLMRFYEKMTDCL